MSEYLLAIYMWAFVVGVALLSTFLYWLGGETAKALGLCDGTARRGRSRLLPPSFVSHPSHPRPSSPGI